MMRMTGKMIVYFLVEIDGNVDSGDGETSQSIRQPPVWRGGWHGNLVNGGETGKTKKLDISYCDLFRTKKKVS